MAKAKTKAPAESSARNNAPVDIRMIELRRIAPSPGNPRKHFDEAKLGELAESIKRHGVQQPIKVRPVPAGTYEVGAGKLNGRDGFFITDQRLFEGEGADRRYTLEGPRPFFEDEAAARSAVPEFEIVMGERRYRASGLAGLETIPAIVEEMDEDLRLELALLENLQREDLNPIEKAEALELLKRRLKVKEIAERIGCSSSTISNSTRLVALPDEIKAHVRDGTLSGSHAEALVRWVDHPELLAAQLKRALDGAPSKDLEKLDWQTASRLSREKKAVMIRNYQRDLLPAGACKGCRDSRWLGDGDRLCMRPDCYEQKLAEAREAAAAAEAEKRRLREEAGIVMYGDLKWNEFENLSGGGPKGCREGCEHRKDAQRPNSTPVLVCLDPKCYKRLTDAATREKNKVRRERLRADFERCIERIIDPAWDDVVAAIAASSAFEGNLCKKAVEMLTELLAERMPGRTVDLQPFEQYGEIGSKLSELTKLERADLIRFTAIARLADEFRQCSDSQYYTPNVMTWLLKCRKAGLSDVIQEGQRILAESLVGVYVVKRVDAEAREVLVLLEDHVGAEDWESKAVKLTFADLDKYWQPEVTPSGKGLLRLADMTPESYVYIDAPPRGCKGDCEHRRSAQAGGGRWQMVCLNPSCHESLVSGVPADGRPGFNCSTCRGSGPCEEKIPGTNRCNNYAVRDEPAGEESPAKVFDQIEPGSIIEGSMDYNGRYEVVSVDIDGLRQASIQNLSGPQRLVLDRFTIDKYFRLADDREPVQGADELTIVTGEESAAVEAAPEVELPEGFTARDYEMTHATHGEIRIREAQRNGRKEFVAYHVSKGKVGHGWRELKGDAEFPILESSEAYDLHLGGLIRQGRITIRRYGQEV